MKQMISGNKMAKKTKRLFNLEKRAVWAMSPVTRVKESGKIYSRNKIKKLSDEE